MDILRAMTDNFESDSGIFESESDESSVSENKHHITIIINNHSQLHHG